MHCINQLQDVESHYSDNGCNLRIHSGSLILTNTLLYNNNPMSQKAFQYDSKETRHERANINQKSISMGMQMLRPDRY